MVSIRFQMYSNVFSCIQMYSNVNMKEIKSDTYIMTFVTIALTGPLGRLLRSFACSLRSLTSLIHSTLLLRSTTLLYAQLDRSRLAQFGGSLTHFAHSLVRRCLKSVSRRSREQSKFLSVESHPMSSKIYCARGQIYDRIVA